MTIRILILSLLFPLGLNHSHADTLADNLFACRQLQNDQQRLHCYDQLKTNNAPTYKGKLSKRTEPFTVEKPTLIRYQSDGVIFVMGLHREDGSVEQNLHLGGGGKGEYLLEKTGRYFLRINGSSSWQVWLEPQK